ncbi:MAG: formylmethanofuran dehydrogenase subunit B [Candidatus Kariarchaeaceae archaeon]|jgi:formylmethanofuran dehydrogenase subunit B
MAKEISDVICPGCGVLCDDIKVKLKDNAVVTNYNTCSKGNAKFLDITTNRLLKPTIMTDETIKEIDLDSALSRTAEILVNAESPLLYGWSATTCEAQRLGIQLSQEISGIVDSTSSFCHGVSLSTLLECSWSTATLGEVMNRADVILYWGSNPIESHPRHMSRYSTVPRGIFRQAGKDERTVVVIDIRKTRTANIADRFLEFEPNQDFEIISVMRSLLNGYSPKIESVANVSLKEVERLLELIKEANFCTIFFGLGLLMSAGTYHNVANLLSFVAELNQFAKVVAIPMIGHYNMIGFNHVCGWLTGFPYGIDFRKKDPMFNPGETTTVELLQKKEIDAMLCIASDPVSTLPYSLTSYLKEIPLICCDVKNTPTTRISDIVIPVALSGIEVSGTAYRMDSVPLYMKSIVSPPDGILSDEMILTKLLKFVREIK